MFVLVSVLSTWVLMLLFWGLEAYAPVEAGQGLRGRAFNFLYYGGLLAVATAVLQPVSVQWKAAVMRLFTGETGAHFEPSESLVSQIVVTLVFAIAWDVWRYWVHRLQHQIPFLWLSHRFHHTETELNASTHGRHHLMNDVVAALAYLPVVVLLGALTPHPVVTFVMFGLWGFVIHLNVRVSFGWLTPWISGPQWHRIHHSSEPRHNNRNFATFFPFIDILFGTYYRPASDEHPRTGLPEGAGAGDLREATVQPVIDGLVMLADGVRSALRYSRRLIARRIDPVSGTISASAPEPSQ